MSPASIPAPDPSVDIDRLLGELTLVEKASLLSGRSLWRTQAVRRDGTDVVPSITLTNGPHGLVKRRPAGNQPGIRGCTPATCFPTAAALGSTWDPALLRRVGRAIGREARAHGVSVVLGPGVNIKRSPLGGRNFEYLSEDPFLTGQLATAIVQGIQSCGVGAALKHYAANNQEDDRKRISVDIDERTLREIYLPAFERVVKQARPWTVMCAYNRINGIFVAEHRELLTDVLRHEWGFEGVVMSDWGAVRDPAQSLAAGVDLQFGEGSGASAWILSALESGRLTRRDIDVAVRRVVELVSQAQGALNRPGFYDAEAHHALARNTATAGIVLLKNDPVDGGRRLLPLSGTDQVALIGELARSPRYQGGGSVQVNPTRLDDLRGALRAAGQEFRFAAGYRLDGAEGDEGVDDAALLAEAVEVARGAGTVIVHLGLPSFQESEGYDRAHLDLPANQIALLRAVAEVNPRVVVVLSNGSPVALSPWQHVAPAIVEAWLGGQAGGSALADVLLGVADPSGRLAETLPARLVDTPAVGNYPGDFGHVQYGERLLVGYRWYDTRRMAVSFPFGHGLSYTTFAYDDVAVEVSGAGPGLRVRATTRVTNTGSRTGSEVVQLYVGDPSAQVMRPARELKAFEKVTLEPGASCEIVFDLSADAFAYWHPVLHRWVVEGGSFVLHVGASSRDIRSSASIVIEGEALHVPLDESSTLAEALAHPVIGRHVQRAVDNAGTDEATLAMIGDAPLATVARLGVTGLTERTLESLLPGPESD